MRNRKIAAVKSKTIVEEIVSYTVEITIKTVTVIVAELLDEKFINHRVVNLGRAGYELLLNTENPEWAVGKPLNDFRKADIFLVMDILNK